MAQLGILPLCTTALVFVNIALLLQLLADLTDRLPPVVLLQCVYACVLIS